MKRDRIDKVAEILDKRGKLTFEQLEEFFPHVSQMTLRRDLFQLEEEGKIIRIRGGAMSVREVQKTSGEHYTKKTTIHTDEKIIIAQKAADLARDQGHGIGRKRTAARGIKGAHRLQKSHHADLCQILKIRAAAAKTAGDRMHERRVAA